MDGADLCFEIVNRVNAGFVYSEAVARFVLQILWNDLLMWGEVYMSWLLYFCPVSVHKCLFTGFVEKN
jgi:hypothetical protein